MEARKTESSKFFQNWCEKRRTRLLLISRFPEAKTIVPKGFYFPKYTINLGVIHKPQRQVENGSRIIVCERQIVGILIGNSDKIFQTMEYSSSKLQTQYNEFINLFP